ncbi:MAG: FAD-dependent monooxygenase [Labilithrix sp.]|nr:FAD-dependent monooxygenase [Labilithrix sp.]MCW5809428.1 FAD-dependent monooxygenase [Labilithrix sp.]
MNIEALHVIVVGGAIAGTAASILLARAGARVTLLERVADPKGVGAGIGIAENGLAVLESIGLGPALAAVAVRVPAPRIVDGAGRVLFVPPGTTPKVMMVRRADLQQLLLDAVLAEPNIERLFGAEVISSDRTGGITVRMDGGARTRRLRGDFVIGADGVHSRVREAGDHEASVSRPGLSYVRAVVAGVEPRGEEAWTSAGLFGSFAVPGGAYVYASAGGRDVRRALADRDLERFRSAWARAYPPAASILARLERWEDLLVNPVLSVHCLWWWSERQVLVGDAAHAMAPNLGQGANSALVDVAVLLDELRRATRLESAFASYQARRQSAVGRVARMSARLGALAEITNPLGRFLRDRMLMPALSLAARTSTPTDVLQEPTAKLLAIGRA